MGKWEAAAALVALGARVDAPAGAGGHTWLSLACQSGDVATVRRLLDLARNLAFKGLRQLWPPPGAAGAGYLAQRPSLVVALA